MQIERYETSTEMGGSHIIIWKKKQKKKQQPKNQNQRYVKNFQNLFSKQYRRVKESPSTVMIQRKLTFAYLCIEAIKYLNSNLNLTIGRLSEGRQVRVHRKRKSQALPSNHCIGFEHHAACLQSFAASTRSPLCRTFNNFTPCLT